jgi:hypothetical protein
MTAATKSAAVGRWSSFTSAPAQLLSPKIAAATAPTSAVSTVPLQSASPGAATTSAGQMVRHSAAASHRS